MKLEFEGLNELEGRILRMIERQPSPGRHAGRSAIHHILRAYRIKDLDAEMAQFRAITGEEEAARAIIHALQRHRYPGASVLNWKDHNQKAAVVPFLSVIGRLVQKMPFVPKIAIETGEDGDIPVVGMIVVLPDGNQIQIKPNPPLRLKIAINGNDLDLADEVNELLSELSQHWGKSFKGIGEAVRKRSQERNGLLYASDQGVPLIIGGLDGELAARRSNIFTCLVAYLLVDMFKGHQEFVLQCLPVFLKMVDALPKES